MGVSSLPKTVTRQRRGCNLNPGLLRLSPARQPTTEPPVGLARRVRSMLLAVTAQAYERHAVSLSHVGLYNDSRPVEIGA